ncbi:hypothetical protein MAR_019976 [Mya arenaria]|uniref:Ig-like domain-containing protein n=1 Tax=Mya arenaria TaxID=6604 RepID=A0ABY7E6N6_MYAAR|nr:hypothetical protein MAR_019976 [Mya arenaria]
MEYKTIVLVYIVIICQGNLKVNSSTSGLLEVVQPAIAGRRVNIIFTPTVYNSDKQVTLEYKYAIVLSSWYDGPRLYSKTYVAEEGRFYLTTDQLAAKWNNTALRAKYGDEESLQAILIIIDLTGTCGYVYLRSQLPILTGTTVELGYFAAPAVITHSDIYVREWYKGIPSSRSVLHVDTDSNLIEREEPNYEFVLEIHNFDQGRNGLYNVRCRNGKHTNIVQLSVPVPQTKPAIGPVTTLQDEGMYIIAKRDHTIPVYCNATGTDLTVEVLFNRRTCKTEESGPDMYSAIVCNAYDADHLASVRCSVLNAAVKDPLFSEEYQLYVVGQASAVEINHTEDLREGLPANITCKVTGSRPPPEIAFIVDTITIDQGLTHSHDDLTYQATLRFVKREWNGKNIRCQYNNSYFTGRSQEHPPSHVLIEDIFSRPGKTVYKCTLIDSNPVCNIKWTADGNTFLFKETENKVDGLTRESWIELNASRNMYRATVQCTPQCQYFESKLNAFQQIPIIPNITFNVARNQKITQEFPKVVTCYAESLPLSHIELIYMQNREKKNVSCLKDVKCSITLEELNIRLGGRMNLECFATYTYQHVTEILTTQVTLYRDDGDAQIDTIDQNRTPKEIIYRIIHALLISVAVAVIALVIGFLMCYRQYKRLKQNAARESCPQANANEDIAVEFSNDEITYTQVNKTRARPEDNKMENQLVYIKLDKEALEASIGKNIKKVADKKVEYVDIDFTQKCQEADGEDNVYANQYGGHM